MDDMVERPHWGFYVLVPGSICLLAVLALHARAHAFWSEHLLPLPDRPALVIVLLALVALHAIEAVYVHRLALKTGCRRSALSWTLQTLLLGYPSTRLLRMRAMAQGPGATT